MTVDLDALAQLARAATPGPWKTDVDQFNEEDGRVVCITDDHIDLLATIGIGDQQNPYDGQWMRDARYIAAASPDVVLALIERIHELQRELDTSRIVAAADREKRDRRIAEVEAQRDMFESGYRSAARTRNEADSRIRALEAEVARHAFDHEAIADTHHIPFVCSHNGDSCIACGRPIVAGSMVTSWSEGYKHETCPTSGAE